jgi:hypothetical protein
MREGLEFDGANSLPRIETSGEYVAYWYSQQDPSSFHQVFVWDLDKTYLDTRIDSLSGLFQAVVERSLSKKNIPGTAELIQVLAQRYTQGLRSGASEGVFPLFFVTASPPQMEERIRDKFAFDLIRPVCCYFKNNLKNLRPGRFRLLSKHVGFKLLSLLALRSRLSSQVVQILWGDDSESDAVIYNLYSDICADRIDDGELRDLLRRKFSVTEESVEQILRYKRTLPKWDPVKRIYINLALDTDPEYYFKFGLRTVPTFNSFQVALDLASDSYLTAEDVLSIAEVLVTRYAVTREQVVMSFLDYLRRRPLDDSLSMTIINQFIQKGFVKRFERPSSLLAENKSAIPWVPERVDYWNDYR